MPDLKLINTFMYVYLKSYISKATFILINNLIDDINKADNILFIQNLRLYHIIPKSAYYSFLYKKINIYNL